VTHEILFIQGGGAGAYEADQQLVVPLRRALGTGYELFYPKMPRESEPDYRNWKRQIEKKLGRLKNGAILVGHSLGGSFLLKYLSDQKVENAIAGVFLIATPYWGDEGWRYEGDGSVTLPKDFPSKLPSGTPLFFYHSRDDEIVPFAHLTFYATKLPQATIQALDLRGHQLKNDLSEVAADIKSL
jgi:uncharacterized protein